MIINIAAGNMIFKFLYSETDICGKDVRQPIRHHNSTRSPPPPLVARSSSFH